MDSEFKEQSKKVAKAKAKEAEKAAFDAKIALVTGSEATEAPAKKSSSKKSSTPAVEEALSSESAE